MALVRRNLVVHFQKSVKVTSTEVSPQSVEVSVIPLKDASNAQTVATYIGGVQTVIKPLIGDDNPVTFSLVPSDFPGLTNPINYRIMWRVGGVTGRTETYDFSMPDSDIDFDQLHSIGNIIDGQAYLQQSDLGVAGRVAKLDDNGNVIDASGIPTAMPTDIATVRQELSDAVGQLQVDDTYNKNYLLDEIGNQVSSSYSLLDESINQVSSSLIYSLNREHNERIDAIGLVSSDLVALNNTVTSNSSSLFGSVAGINETLSVKADLDDGGRVPVVQIPDEAITHWIPLSSAEDRLSLVCPDDVQKGDVVLTPTGVYSLIGEDPSNTSDWYRINQVLSVNGQIGTVELSASDVGAISSEGTIPQSQVTDLPATLASLASNSLADSLQSQITGIVNDDHIVRLNSNNQIDSGYLDSGVAYVNVLNQVVTKDGTVLSDPSTRGVISINGKSGVLTLGASDVGAIAVGTTLPQSQIIGLVSALSTKADLVSGTVPLNQLPSIPQSQVTGLTASLSGKADLINGILPMGQIPVMSVSKISGLSDVINSNGLTTLSNVVSRITNLENRTGSSGGSVSYLPAVMWNGATGSDITDLSSIVLSSPFGIYSSGPNTGTYYYNSSGVSSADAAYPVITSGGHFKLYKWNESNPADPTFALASDLSSVSTSVASLATTVGTKANQADLVTLNTRVTSLSVAKADLDGSNTLVASQVPFIAKANPKVVASLSALRALTTTQVHVGDQAIISSGADMGTYTLVGADPSQLGINGWVIHPVPVSFGGSGVGTVVSLSGPSGTKIMPDGTGNISLVANDIGAAPSSLSTTVSDLTTTVATKQTIDQVNTAIGSSQAMRGRVDYVVRPFTASGVDYCANGLTITAGAPSGAPYIDKSASNAPIPAPNNALVLLTNQSDSKLNGIWKVNSTGVWTRPINEYPVGSRVYPGTTVLVNCSFGTTGSTNYTVWQNDPPAAPTPIPYVPAVVDSVVSGVNNRTWWVNRGSLAPVSVQGSSGIIVSGTYPNIVLGSGTSDNFVRHHQVSIVPTSSTGTRTVTHGFNNNCPSVTVIEEVTGNMVLVGWKAVDSNSILLDFSPAIMSSGSTYRVSVQG